MASGDVVGIIIRDEPPASSFATLDTRNSHSVYDFDDTTDEEMVYKFYLTNKYSGGGLTIEIFSGFTSDTSNNVVWQAAVERVTDSNQDIDSDGFAAFQSSGAVAVPSTSGFIKKFTVAFTAGAQMDSIAAGEAGRLKIRRDADNTSATDSVVGDAELYAVIIKET